MNKKGYLNKLMLAALALLMSFSVSLKAYAADVPSLDTSKAKVLEKNPGIVLSDFYVIQAIDNSYAHLFIHSDSVQDNFFLYRYVYADDVYDIRFGSYSDGILSDLNVHFDGASYDISDYSFRTLVGNESINLVGNYYVKNLKSFETNIPYFDSAASVISYYDSGDTSGLLNSESLPKLYDPTIETPKDFQINFSTSKIFDDKGFFNECDFQFTWKQSEDTDLNGYQTEIYIQATHCKVSITNLFSSADSREQKLGDKLLISSASTSYDNKASIKWNDLVAYLNKDGANLFGASNAGGVCCTYPIYFWIRNVKGNTYGDWIKVTVTPDNVVVDGNDYLGTGKGTVSHGYELVDGSGNGVQKENQYGQGYHVDIPYTSTNSIIDYIKSGFGLLGDNGLISFFKDMFSFLPDPVWTIIFTMVGVCAIIIIIKVAK